MNQKNLTTFFIQLSDQVAYISCWKKTSPEVRKRSIPLYVSLISNHIKFFADSFILRESCFCVMKSEEELQEYLDSIGKEERMTNPTYTSYQYKAEEYYKDHRYEGEIDEEEEKMMIEQMKNDSELQKEYETISSLNFDYIIPTPLQLWCIILHKLVEQTCNLATTLNYENPSIVISYPDMIPESLKKLIMVAFDHCKILFPENNLRIITNSVAASCYLLFEDLRGMHQIESKVIYEDKIIAVVDQGFYSTECYVYLVKNKTVVIIAKGRVDVGMDKWYQEVKWKYVDGADEKISRQTFDKWSRLEKNHYEAYKNIFIAFTGDANSPELILNQESDRIYVSYNELNKMTTHLTNQIYEMINETLKNSYNILKNFESDELIINNEIFTVKGKTASYALRKEEISNHFVNESFFKNCRIKSIARNQGETIFSFGGAYYAHALRKRYDEEYDKLDKFSNIIMNEITICELISKDRFVIKDKDNIVVCSFPKQPVISISPIPISNEDGKIMENENYYLYDTINGNDYQIGSIIFTIKADKYFISLNKYLGTLQPNGIINEQKTFDLIDNNDCLWIEITSQQGFCQMKRIGKVENYKHPNYCKEEMKIMKEEFDQFEKRAEKSTTRENLLQRERDKLKKQYPELETEIMNTHADIIAMTDKDMDDACQRFEAYKNYIYSKYGKK